MKATDLEQPLEPCPNPWCEDGIYLVETREGGFFRVGCTCGVAGPASTSEEKAIKFWNTRAIQSTRIRDDALIEWAQQKSAEHHRLAVDNEDLRTEHIASSSAYRELAREVAALTTAQERKG